MGTPSSAHIAFTIANKTRQLRLFLELTIIRILKIVRNWIGMTTMAMGSFYGCHSDSVTVDLSSVLDGIQDERTHAMREPPRLVWIQPSADVEPVRLKCLASSEEDCPTLDASCREDNREDCATGRDLMQITASWDTNSDIDLYVTESTGDTLSFQFPSSRSGGEVDHIGRGACDPFDSNSRLERIRWIQKRPPPGVYQVHTHYWGECLSGSGPTEVFVSVMIGSENVGFYRYTLLPGERHSILRLMIE